MDPGYRSPLIDFFRRGESARDARMLAAQGALPTAPHEQLALLVLLSDDKDGEIAATADATLKALPEAAVRAFLAGSDVPAEMKDFFAARGISPAPGGADGAPFSAAAEDDDEDEEGEGEAATPTLLANLPIKKKIKLAFKGTREQRAQLIRDPNKLVAAAVLSSPKLTDAEVESFTKMQNVTEEVLRVIATNRTWLKNYGVALGLVKNAKTPPALSMQLLQRISERDIKMLAVDRNVPEVLRLAARKAMVKKLK
ncbi:MAG: hypothetical protein ACRD1U_08570 [Vicinamibacterales bacterium]